MQGPGKEMGGYPHMSGLVIAVPLSGRPLPPRQLFTYAQLAPPMNYNVRYINTDPMNPMPIDAARNFFAQAALDYGAKYLFMMDEDTAVPPHTIRQLIYHLDHHDDWAVCAGIYCQKGDSPAPMVFRGNGNGPYWKWHAGELFECTGIGMGCAMIRVEVFKDLPKPWFKTVDDNSPTLDGINRGCLWTEDLWFCNLIAEGGPDDSIIHKTEKQWKIYADGSILPDHLDIVTGKATRLPSDSYPVLHLAVPKGSKKILDLGSGESKYQCDEGEVVSADIREEVNPDYRCDIRKLPFGTGQFDVVYSSHTLEHIARDEVDATLDEWIRVLKDDGELRLILPSVLWAAEQIVNGQRAVEKLSDDVLNVLYGAQTFRENFHKMGFTPKTIEAMLRHRGFKHMDFTLDGYNIAVRAVREVPESMQVRTD